MGRSRGGLTSKIHLAADSRCRLLVRLTSAGQCHDNLAFQPVLARLRIRRHGPGRPRTRPGRVLSDKAYSNRANRAYLRRRNIQAVIPERADEIRNRRQRGRRGGRPPAFEPAEYAHRNSVERAINKLKQHRALATRYDCEDVATASDLRPDPRYDRPLCLAFDLSTAGPGRDVLPPDPAGVSR